jgi:hypothetical protein
MLVLSATPEEEESAGECQCGDRAHSDANDGISTETT